MIFQSARNQGEKSVGSRWRPDEVWVRAILRDESGQATVEYALVMLGAAAVAGMLLAWAVSSGSIEQLMTTIVNSVISDATPPTP